jgi:hypothetical protein
MCAQLFSTAVDRISEALVRSGSWHLSSLGGCWVPDGPCRVMMSVFMIRTEDEIIITVGESQSLLMFLS